jgi:hypothetical protein
MTVGEYNKPTRSAVTLPQFLSIYVWSLTLSSRAWEHHLLRELPFRVW